MCNSYLIINTSFRYQGSVPQEFFCQLPEAAAIFGNTTEIEVTTRCPNPGCFTYGFDYEQDVMNQLIAMTKQSLQCTQSLEFSCLSAPIRDLVSILVFNHKNKSRITIPV